MPAQRRPASIFSVTAALLACGAAFGSFAAVLAAAIGFRLTGQSFVRYGVNLLPFVAWVGAVLGVSLLPATAWVFLRRVRLGLVLAATFVGAVAGGVAGWLLPGYPDDLMGGPPAGVLSLQSVHGVIGGVAGFALAAVILRVKFSPGRAADLAVARPAAWQPYSRPMDCR